MKSTFKTNPYILNIYVRMVLYIIQFKNKKNKKNEKNVNDVF